MLIYQIVTYNIYITLFLFFFFFQNKEIKNNSDFFNSIGVVVKLIRELIITRKIILKVVTAQFKTVFFDR